MATQSPEAIDNGLLHLRQGSQHPLNCGQIRLTEAEELRRCCESFWAHGQVSSRRVQLSDDWLRALIISIQASPFLIRPLRNANLVAFQEPMIASIPWYCR